jgi:hypothetical protein
MLTETNTRTAAPTATAGQSQEMKVGSTEYSDVTALSQAWRAQADHAAEAHDLARQALRRAEQADDREWAALRRLILADPASIGLPPIHPVWREMLTVKWGVI